MSYLCTALYRSWIPMLLRSSKNIVAPVSEPSKMHYFWSISHALTSIFLKSLRNIPAHIVLKSPKLIMGRKISLLIWYLGNPHFMTYYIGVALGPRLIFSIWYLLMKEKVKHQWLMRLLHETWLLHESRENLSKIYFQVETNPGTCFILELECGTMNKSTELWFLHTPDSC